MSKRIKQPGIVNAEDFRSISNTTCDVGGRWVLARPLPLYGIGTWLRAIWLVATGRADALVWFGQ